MFRTAPCIFVIIKSEICIPASFKLSDSNRAKGATEGAGQKKRPVLTTDRIISERKCAWDYNGKFAMQGGLKKRIKNICYLNLQQK